ncbi:transporter substrate-binding domain-containing protein [Dehalobacterium formicoaceticum]|uniref:transporter substrate-binding domain-containing protein n=1 Tax=Dehalobacterium formicoaceticum TaxID=51515 RepID=UPI000B7EDACD|nr:transporter substrate-binding domain-containing protein [Dehalobacterium formicoaceticum]
MIIEEKTSKMRSLSDFENATFAIVEGMVYDEWVLKLLPEAHFHYFRTINDCLAALKNGDVEVFPYEDVMLRYISANLHESFTIINIDNVNVKVDDYGFAVNFNRPDLKKAIDDTIAEIKANGIYEKMIKRWFPKVGATGIMPKIELTGKNGTLKLGTSAVERPFTFIVGDKVTTGFDIELAKRICSRLDMDLEITDILFSELIASLVSGEVDMIGAAVIITEERAKKVLFSEPYFQGKMAFLVKL